MDELGRAEGLNILSQYNTISNAKSQVMGMGNGNRPIVIVYEAHEPLDLMLTLY